jgi:hypothetical protein
MTRVTRLPCSFAPAILSRTDATATKSLHHRHCHHHRRSFIIAPAIIIAVPSLSPLLSSLPFLYHRPCHHHRCSFIIAPAFVIACAIIIAVPESLPSS